mmetsp:Transcript_2749/g.1902  ORF Transcript_2749/g.1902 Transcript_2749/m.1902 type:complete len:94 (-) Transcript_2749:235-516(-)
MASLNNPREQGCACMFGEEFLYVFGGVDRSKKYPYKQMKTIEKYSISNNTWSVIEISGQKFSLPILSLGCFQLNSKEIMMFGGKILVKGGAER